MAIVRRSVKREAVLSLLRLVDCHPTAEWVHGQLKERFPDLSLGTVYRNLRQLEAEGLIVALGAVDGQERFDGDISDHAHFVCERCGAVTDVELKGDDGLAARVERELGARVARRDVKLRGICKSCINKDMRA